MTLGSLFPNGISELFTWEPMFFEGTPFAFNKTAMMVLVSTLICVVVFVVGTRKRALVPAGLQNFAEAGYEIVEENVTVAAMGDEGKPWTPFLCTLFFWIFFINIWSIIPGIQFPATSRIAIPLYLAIQTYFIFIVVGFMRQGPFYVFKAIVPPGVPKLLLPLVALIELFSKFIVRPFSLAIRLFANMFAGHVLLSVFAIMCAELLQANSGAYQILFVPLPLLGLIAMTGFELLVALLQAYIFTMLTAVYIGESLHEEH